MMEDRRWKWVGQEKMSKQNAFVYLWRLSKQVTVLRWRSFWSSPTASGRRRAIHRAVGVSQLTESSKVIDRGTGRTRGGALKCEILNSPEKSVLMLG